jgi:hypothetical protein
MLKQYALDRKKFEKILEIKPKFSTIPVVDDADPVGALDVILSTALSDMKKLRKVEIEKE